MQEPVLVEGPIKVRVYKIRRSANEVMWKVVITVTKKTGVSKSKKK